MYSSGNCTIRLVLVLVVFCLIYNISVSEKLYDTDYVITLKSNDFLFQVEKEYYIEKNISGNSYEIVDSIRTTAYFLGGEKSLIFEFADSSHNYLINITLDSSLTRDTLLRILANDSLNWLNRLGDFTNGSIKDSVVIFQSNINGIMNDYEVYKIIPDNRSIHIRTIFNGSQYFIQTQDFRQLLFVVNSSADARKSDDNILAIYNIDKDSLVSCYELGYGVSWIYRELPNSPIYYTKVNDLYNWGLWRYLPSHNLIDSLIGYDYPNSANILGLEGKNIMYNVNNRITGITKIHKINLDTLTILDSK